MKKITILITVMLFAFIANAQYTLTDNDVEVQDGRISSCNYDFSQGTDIIIPNELDGQVIEGIEGNAFYFYTNPNLTEITSLVLPESLTYIGAENFTNCSNLASVTFPESLIYIGNNSFSFSGISNLDFPSSIEYIGSSAFSHCELTAVSFADNSNISFIGTEVFNYNSGLSSVTLPTNVLSEFTNYYDGNDNIYAPGDNITLFTTNYIANASYTITDNDVIMNDDGTLDLCTYHFGIKNIIIPDVLQGITITAINSGFAYHALTSILLPNSLINLNNDCFKDNNLTEVNIPSTVTSIGNSAFSDNQLTVLNIPNTVTTIGSSAFINNQLTEINIPNSVENIGEWAFKNNQLTAVTFETNSNISVIDVDAFYGNNLNGIELPVNVRESTIYFSSKGIVYHAGDIINDFSEYSSFNVVEYYTLTDNDVVMSNDSLLNCSYDFSIKHIVIPDILDGQTVKFIHNYTSDFSNKDIESVILPNTLEDVGIYTFLNNKLKHITIPESVFTITSDAFKDNQLLTVSFKGNNIRIINSGAFENNNIEDITIKSSVIEIYGNAFKNNNLTEINFDANSNIRNIDKFAFIDNPVTSYILPTHASANFNNYKNTLTTDTYNEGEQITIASEINITVDIDPYTVIFNDWDGTQLSIDNNVEHGFSSAAPIAPTRAGYTFTGWDTHLFPPDLVLNIYGYVNYVISDSTITAEYELNTSINTVSTKEIHLYPNPVSNQLTIYNNELGTENILISDISGKIIKQLVINTNCKLTIDVSSLNKGVYFVKAGTNIQKFIKE